MFINKYPSKNARLSNSQKMMQERQGVSIGCIEEECYKSGFIDKKQLKNFIKQIPESEYKEYLLTL